MPVRQNGGSKPAQSKDKSTRTNCPKPAEAYRLPAREVFKWASTKTNTYLTIAAEGETYAGDHLVLDEVCGLQLSGMYRILSRELMKVFKDAKNDDERHFALVCFAARIYRAGIIEGAKEGWEGI